MIDKDAMNARLHTMREEHQMVINALSRRFRVQGGTKTFEKHQADYERHRDAFDKAHEELQKLIAVAS